ncbi:MAG: hemerythrin domain-containing protein [Sulfuricellaceae bacterium]|jgi:hemerythrin-like domain-containing protein
MSTISEFLTGEHHHCDDLFAAAEDDAAQKNWSKADEDFHRFRRSTETHFEVEEKILFPAFENATGMAMGPTQVMRMEHGQMRDVFAQMADAIAKQDADEYLGLSETLLMLMQQHNLKEEQILYRMADQVLGNASDALIGDMKAMAEGA